MCQKKIYYPLIGNIYHVFYHIEDKITEKGDKNMGFNKKQIKIAVDWWADVLHTCKQSGLSTEERKNASNRGYEFAEMLMQLNKPQINDEQVYKFSSYLIDYLSSFKGDYICLSVDYDPDLILQQALDAGNIQNVIGVLPIKTIMWLDKGEVQVRYGYGAPIETLLKDNTK
jgi:hypothetical protein